MGGENDASHIVKNTETHSVILLSLFSGRVMPPVVQWGALQILPPAASAG